MTYCVSPQRGAFLAIWYALSASSESSVGPSQITSSEHYGWQLIHFLEVFHRLKHKCTDAACASTAFKQIQDP